MSKERFLAFRRSLPAPPRLEHVTVTARGIPFAVWKSPERSGHPPLVCINGGLIYDHRLLWPALSPLAEHRQLILYDQRGRGRTPPPPGMRAARAEHDAGDVAALRESLGIAQWDVLGHSWGGGIAMMAASLDPDGTRRLVLVDAVGATSDFFPHLHADALQRLGRMDPALRSALETADPNGDVSEGRNEDPAAREAYSRAMYPAWFADPELSRTLTPPRASSPTGAIIAARLRREGYDWRPLLRALTAPTLVIHGEEDLLSVDVARATAAILPRVRLELIPHAGHMPFWEAPERFFGLVDEFLSSLEPVAFRVSHEAT